MSDLDRYQQYRQAGQQLNSDILEMYSNRELLLRSAADLGIEFDGVHLEYASESEMSVHFEYALYEYCWGGKTAAERYLEEEHWEMELEQTILEATLAADTSLFEVNEVSASDSRVGVVDLLNEDQRYSILDVNLSQTTAPGTILFFRPIRYEEFTVTSGVSLPFPSDKKEHLLEEYEQRVDRTDSQSVSRQRFVAFHDLYRKHGISISYN